jgi:hypothetical protein
VVFREVGMRILPSHQFEGQMRDWKHSGIGFQPVVFCGDPQTGSLCHHIFQQAARADGYAVTIRCVGTGRPGLKL